MSACEGEEAGEDKQEDQAGGCEEAGRRKEEQEAGELM
jgi:hypothetical protein